MMSEIILLSFLLLQLISYLHPIVLVVVFFCMVLAVFLIVLSIRQETLNLPYSKFRMLLILYSTGLIILLFFRPSNQIYQTINLVPFSTITFYFSEKVNWLIMTFPFCFSSRITSVKLVLTGSRPLKCSSRIIRSGLCNSVATN